MFANMAGMVVKNTERKGWVSKEQKTGGYGD